MVLISIKSGGMFMDAFSKKGNRSIPEIMPIIPTMDVVVFPHMIVPLLVVDERIIKGINKALEESKLVLLLASSKDSSNYNEAISTKDLYEVGTIATIMRVVNIPDGGIKVLVQGVSRARADNIIAEEDMLYSYISPFEKDQSESDTEELEEKIRNNARDSMNKSQKEFYLREQLKAIKKELGDEDEDIDQLDEKLSKLKIDEDTKKEIKRNISRLERTSPDSMEATVLRNYLETILGLPWGIETEDNLDIEHAKEILEQDHYGLKEIKERIF